MWNLATNIKGSPGGSTVLASDTAPSTITTPVNSLWVETDTGILYVLLDDGSSIQWVAVGDAVSGDVLGPAGVAATNRIAVFDGTDGKHIKDGGYTIATLPGGGVPGGATTQLQYNNAGAFAGVTGSVVSGSTVTFGGDLGVTGDLYPNTNIIFGSNPLRGLLWSVGGYDLSLLRAGVGTLAVAHGIDPSLPSALHVYKTTDSYTASTIYERGTFDWTTQVGVLTIGAQAGGGGTLRPLNLVGSALTFNGAAVGGGSIAPLQLTDANTVEQYNGTTSQSFRVYNTRTSGSVYERAVFDFTTTTNVLTIGTQQLGATARNIEIVPAGGQTTVKRDLAGASATNSVLMISDNSTIPDTGLQAQLIVRNNRAAGNGHAAIAIDKGHAGDASLVSFMSVGVSKWDFGLIGTGLSFRDTTTYRTVLELSAGAPNWTILVQGDGMVSFWPLVAVSAGGSASRALTLGGSNTGIYHGSGVPTISAAQGSLYLRTDGSSTSTRMYVNTNGTTGWAAVTTAS